MILYKPMLARDADSPFSSPEWIYEVKWDGIRAISYLDGVLSIRSRSGKELVEKFPELEELRDLAKNVVLDGEIVVIREGKVDFQAIMKRNQANSQKEIERLSRTLPATYIVFDILEKNGESLVDKPLNERKTMLKGSLREGRYVVLSDFIEGQGEAYYTAAIRRGLEGVIAKRKLSRYEQGRSGSWLKIKRVRSCDCVVFGYTRGEGSRESTFGALLLGLYDDGKAVYVGRVGTGFTQGDLESLKASFKELETDRETIPGAETSVEPTWLRPELVCEVGYQSVTRDGMLRMARFHGLRPDKEPRECTIDQIAPSGLKEYASKRDFSVTTEPTGGRAKGIGKTFVVQEHSARRLHYDLRLERDGVLKSWAVPKEPPTRPNVRRLAVEVEDHPIDYAGFEGSIPEGQYGAGTVRIWDKGVYEPLKWEDDKIEFVLQGERLSGKYVLVRLKKGKENEWLLLKAGGKDG